MENAKPQSPKKKDNAKQVDNFIGILQEALDFLKKNDISLLGKEKIVKEKQELIDIISNNQNNSAIQKYIQKNSYWINSLKEELVKFNNGLNQQYINNEYKEFYRQNELAEQKKLKIFKKETIKKQIKKNNNKIKNLSELEYSGSTNLQQISNNKNKQIIEDKKIKLQNTNQELKQKLEELNKSIKKLEQSQQIQYSIPEYEFLVGEEKKNIKNKQQIKKKFKQICNSLSLAIRDIEIEKQKQSLNKKKKKQKKNVYIYRDELESKNDRINFINNLPKGKFYNKKTIEIDKICETENKEYEKKMQKNDAQKLNERYRFQQLEENFVLTEEDEKRKQIRKEKRKKNIQFNQDDNTINQTINKNDSISIENIREIQKTNKNKKKVIDLDRDDISDKEIEDIFKDIPDDSIYMQNECDQQNNVELDDFLNDFVNNKEETTEKQEKILDEFIGNKEISTISNGDTLNNSLDEINNFKKDLGL